MFYDRPPRKKRQFRVNPSEIRGLFEDKANLVDDILERKHEEMP